MPRCIHLKSSSQPCQFFYSHTHGPIRKRRQSLLRSRSHEIYSHVLTLPAHRWAPSRRGNRFSITLSTRSKPGLASLPEDKHSPRPLPSTVLDKALVVALAPAPPSPRSSKIQCPDCATDYNSQTPRNLPSTPRQPTCLLMMPPIAPTASWRGCMTHLPHTR
jgi:hypothetical protein